METPAEIIVEPVAKATSMFDNLRLQIFALSNQALALLPSNFNVWLIAITCLVVLVAISRIITLQKSVTELQSRPIFDENSVRLSVRQHLEETVKAMEQHNKAQHMARQAEAQARDEQMRQMVIKQAQEQQAHAQAQAQAQTAEVRVPVVQVPAQEAEHPRSLEAKAQEAKAPEAEDEHSGEEERLVQTPPRKKSSKKHSTISA